MRIAKLLVAALVVAFIGLAMLPAQAESGSPGATTSTTDPSCQHEGQPGWNVRHDPNDPTKCSEVADPNHTDTFTPSSTTTTQCPDKPGSQAFVNGEGGCTYCPNSKDPGTTVKLDDKYHKYCQYDQHGPVVTAAPTTHGPLAYTGDPNISTGNNPSDNRTSVTSTSTSVTPSVPALTQALKAVREIQPAPPHRRSNQARVIMVALAIAIAAAVASWGIVRYRGRP